jgi:TonB family protein
MILAQKHQYNPHIRIASLLILLVLGLGTTMSTAQQGREHLPTVATAGVPFYPPIARVARMQGVVRLHVTTDGKRVSAISVESGPPMLAQAAEENVKTWQFKDHAPTTFAATFQYKMLPESECEMDSGTVLLRLPTEVDVSAKGVQTCDPTVDNAR